MILNSKLEKWTIPSEETVKKLKNLKFFDDLEDLDLDGHDLVVTVSSPIIDYHKYRVRSGL